MKGLPRLRPGDMRDRIELRHPARVGDGQGGFVTTFPAAYATPYAEVQGINGREAVIGEALQGVSFYRIRVYWRDDVLQADQVRYRGIDLNISSVSDPNGDRRQLLILADTGSAQATS